MSLNNMIGNIDLEKMRSLCHHISQGLHTSMEPLDERIIVGCLHNGSSSIGAASLIIILSQSMNNTIIGLCDSIVVVEAGLTGGSLDAGLRTLEDRKPLYVPIYSDYPESALGNKVLMERGAKGIGRNRYSQRANVMALL